MRFFFFIDEFGCVGLWGDYLVVVGFLLLVYFGFNDGIVLVIGFDCLE